jgi:hypothetical protein
MICGLVHNFGTNTTQNGINDDKTSSNTVPYMFHCRVLTLVLLGEVEAFPTVYPLKPEVMGERC